MRDWIFIDHASQQLVDFLLPLAVVAAVDEVVVLLPPPAVGRVELEVPEEVVGLLEGGPHGEDLVDEVLHADDVVLAQNLLDDLIVDERRAPALNLAVATLVDQLLN